MKLNLRLLTTIGICLLLQMGMLSAQSSRDTVLTKDLQNKDVMRMEVFDTKGQLVEVGKFSNGKKEGVFRNYNTKNTVSTVQEFSNDLPDGIFLKFGDNGALELEESYSKGLLDGRRVQYRFGGIRKSVEYFKNGKLDGNKIVFYESGFKQEDANYKDGLRESVTTWYNQSEIPTIQYTYRAGMMNGPAKTFFYNSNVQTEGMYLNDQEDGEWKHYDEKGNFIKSVFYKNGKMIKEVIQK